MKRNSNRTLRVGRLIGLLTIVACMAASVPVRGQMTAPSPIPSLGGAGGSVPDKALTPPSSMEAQVFSSAVDPADYHLGPGDVLQCRFWTSDQSYYPVVSSDEILIVSHVGAFSTHGKTLADLRDEVYKKAADLFQRFANDKARKESSSSQTPLSLSLYQPRRIYVKVQGDVMLPSGFALLASTRADVAVDLANKPPADAGAGRDQAQERQMRNEREQHQRIESAFGKREAEPASQRNITISHSDGSMERLDLVRYGGTHDPKASPLLREGDVIYVPFRDVTAGVIGVYGAVRAPGEFEFVEGDSLSSSIKYAFGPTAQAELDHVELTRALSEGDPKTEVYDLRAISAGQAPDVPLMRGDRVILRGKREKMHAAVVAVRGEVVQPGVFPIDDGVTHISDVIREAGGLTPSAYARAGRVLRHGHTEQLTAGSQEEVLRASRLANLTVEDTSSYLRQTEMRQTDLVVDLDRVLAKGDKSADIPLSDGDEIFIPERPTTVYVYGFVRRSGYVPFEPGASLSYYIAQAGGYAEGSVQSKTVVVKVGTKAWMDPGNTLIEAGDEIYVPREPAVPADVKQNQTTALVAMFAAIGGLLLNVYLYVLKKP